MGDHSSPSPLVALNNRTAALLRTLGSPGADYPRTQPPGQVRIQLYNVRGNDPGAWCAPHCDDACNGEELRDAGMRAVAMVSCKVPELGGETSLSHARVLYRPTTVGDLIVFGLKQSNVQVDTDGRTEHAGCPVRRGEKWIVTMRLYEGGAEAAAPPKIVPAHRGHDFYDPPLVGQPLVLRKGSEQIEAEAGAARRKDEL